MMLWRGVVCAGLKGWVLMRNDSVRLTPRGEMFAEIVTALLVVGMGYAIVRVFAIVVVKLGQVLGII